MKMSWMLLPNALREVIITKKENSAPNEYAVHSGCFPGKNNFSRTSRPNLYTKNPYAVSTMIVKIVTSKWYSSVLVGKRSSVIAATRKRIEVVKNKHMIVKNTF